MIRTGLLCCALLAAAPVHAETIGIGGTERTYAAFVPDRRPAPLVLVLHGNTQLGTDMQTRASWPALARREQFIAIYPDGLNRAWADLRDASEVVGRKPPPGTDDVAFLMAVVARYIAEGTADPRRIYVAGVSNGGAMAMTLACREPQAFAAAAAVIMSLTETMAQACRPQTPIPILLMNGTADPLVAYHGGRSTGRHALPNVWASERTIAFWREVNGCDAGHAAATALPDTDANDRSTVTRIDSRCPPGRDVLLYRIDGGGHRMPGNAPDAKFPHAVDAILGPQNHDVDGPEVIWEFFRRFAR